MGASSSTANASAEARDLREQEALASASLSLPLLRAVFSRSSDLAEIPYPPEHFHDLLARWPPAGEWRGSRGAGPK
uniref:Uncharacterized protein n=1 Tax=Aegilops tauschii TaxID=37682 RepID=M8D4Y4_AEGTA